MRIVLVLVSCALLAGVWNTSALADDRPPFCRGADCFPTSVNVFGATLVPASRGTYSYYGFRVFDAVLYAESPAVVKTEFLGVAPIALRLCYHRKVEPERFRRSAIEALEENPAAPLQTFRAQVDAIHAHYREVQEGDCYQLAFNPGVGTVLAFNDVPLILIPGDDFAAAYFGIWLSKYTFSRSLMRKLITPIEPEQGS